MSVWKKVFNKVGKGRHLRPKRNIFQNCRIKTTTGAPSDASPVGTLLYNSYDDDCYVCTVAAGTWVKINA